MELLIAHEDIAMRGAVANALAGRRDGGLMVIEVDEGMEALELLLGEDAPRLAVVDWDLPGLDGPELCRLVRDFHLGGPPYIVLLADDGHPDIESGLEAGANDCIRTPASAAEIRERVDAGWDFVKVPWEQANRGAMLDAGRSPDADDEAPKSPDINGATLDAVRSADTDDAVWGASEVDAAPAGAAKRREAQLLALLR